ncbi:MAG: MFS transporter [Acidimicrobiia bacterium]|nr:MFS transporter [Acidimicrobiia bacterium]
MTTAETRPVPPPAEARAFGAPFVLVVASALAYFVGLGILAPVLPRYVEDELGGGGAQVGIVVGAFALTAALLRPWVGRVGDQRGRRVLVLGGCLVAGVSILGYGLPGGLAVLVLMRLVSGIGEAATFVGAATSAQDLAPPARRGQATSFFSIAIYGGLSAGPPLGDWIYRQHGSGPVWVAASAATLLGALLALGLPKPDRTAKKAAPTGPPARGLSGIFHPAALRPGVVLGLAATGYAGFASFVPLYIDDIGVSTAGPVFVEYGVIVLAVRILGSRLPDALGTRRGPLAALALQAAGLLLLGAWASPTGLYVGTGIFAAGVSLLYPALFPAVVDAAPEAERSRAIATFTLFFDLSQGIGAPVLGLVVAGTNERGAFVGAGLASVAGYLLHRRAPLAPPSHSGEPCPPPEPGE